MEERSGIPNHGRFVFLDPRAVELYPQWTKTAGDVVTQLRAETGRRPDDRELAALVGELTSRSSQFASLWATHDVRWHTTGSKRFRHRTAGELDLDYEAMALAADPGHTLITFTARDGSPAEQALAFLASWSGGSAPAVTPVPGDPASRRHR